MVKVVRPSYVTVDTGAKNLIGAGPKSKNGKMDITVKMRSHGDPLDVIEILVVGHPEDNCVKLTARNLISNEVWRIETVY